MYPTDSAIEQMKELSEIGSPVAKRYIARSMFPRYLTVQTPPSNIVTSEGVEFLPTHRNEGSVFWEDSSEHVCETVYFLDRCKFAASRTIAAV